MDTQITQGFKRPFTLAPVDGSGNPAKLDGPVRGEVVNGSANVTVNEDGVSGFIVAASTPAEPSQVDLVADADLGEGVEELRLSINVETVGARAKNLGATIGDEVPQ